MTEFGPDVIVDANGDPVGRYRDNQDPDDVRRLHAVPKTNAKGAAIMDGSEQVVDQLPLDDPKTIAQLAVEGLKVAEDGISLVALDEQGPDA